MKKAHRTRVTLVSKYRKNIVTLLAYPENLKSFAQNTGMTMTVSKQRRCGNGG